MEYLTTYIRQEGGGSLLLQEYLCRDIPACFACLCTREGEEGRRIMERLLSWNRRFPWHRAVKGPALWLDRAERELKEEMETACGDSAAVRARRAESVAAREADRPGRLLWRLLVCVDQELLTLGNGYELCLLSGSFGQGCARRLNGNFRGCLEPGAGILLAEDDFLENIPTQALAQAVRPWEIRTQRQSDKRLKELAESGRSQGENRKTAVLILTKAFSPEGARGGFACLGE